MAWRKKEAIFTMQTVFEFTVYYLNRKARCN